MPKKDTKSLIIKISFQEFLMKGFQSTSMANIVKATKLSKGAVYHHFASKEALYNAVIDTYFLTYFREMDWSIVKGKNPEELSLFIDTYFNTFIGEVKAMTNNSVSRYYILFFEAFEFHPTFKEETQAFYSQMKKVILETIPNEKRALELIARNEGLLFWNAIFP